MSKLQHGNRLHPSTQDDIMLGIAVEDRFLDLCAAYRRIRGIDLVPPRELDADMLRWRQMRVRHKQADYRHTEAEMESTKEIGTWLVNTNAALRNQPPVALAWKD